MTKLYKWIKIGGLLSFIPIAMASGPLAGYFLADYLHIRYGAPELTFAIFITVGFLASMFETVRIVRLALKTEGEADGKP